MGAGQPRLRHVDPVRRARKHRGREEPSRGPAHTAPEQRAEVLAFVLAEQLATVLGTAADTIDHNTALPELGLDSLLAVELAARVANLLGGQVSALEFSRGTGLVAIARHLANGLEVN
ncbi:acyl carrier protein [Amycolatopsis sp. EV170708-02-1]|uniref:acyl carrier protein n=1 Tax=Amycolatopsis sp. EV170708-02-1 TaxID=2919322 RepID=UPI0037C02A2E